MLPRHDPSQLSQDQRLSREAGERLRRCSVFSRCQLSDGVHLGSGGGGKGGRGKFDGGALAAAAEEDAAAVQPRGYVMTEAGLLAVGRDTVAPGGVMPARPEDDEAPVCAEDEAAAADPEGPPTAAASADNSTLIVLTSSFILAYEWNLPPFLVSCSTLCSW